jgi:hypothetical protein
VDANAKLNAAIWWKASISFDHAVQHFDGAAHGVYDAAKLNDSSIAGALHYTPVMHGDCRVNQIAAERSQPRKCPILVGASKSAVTHHIGGQDCYEFAGFDHGTPRAGWIIAESLTETAPTAATRGN